VRRLFLSAACLLAVAACGEEFNAGPLEADPLHFAEQRFDCDDASEIPTCPPFRCAVDETGTVHDCIPSCNFENNSTAFEGPEGVDLCVPRSCTVEAEHTQPECDPTCAEDDVTLYVFLYTCN
jgi:hypothetical protein